MNWIRGSEVVTKFLQFLTLASLLLVASCGENKQQQEQVTQEATQDQEEEKEDSKTILFFGNSLTAGLGLDPDEAFPAVIQAKIDSLDLPYQVINAGLSGETTAAGKNRIGWILNQQVDIFVLELGANDGLRGIAVDETKRNLQAIIDTVRQKSSDIEIILAGMQIPPNLGAAYTSDFRAIFPELARENDLYLIPFLLEGVAGDTNLNQPDGVHPTAEGQEIVARNVWEVLEKVIRAAER